MYLISHILKINLLISESIYCAPPLIESDTSQRADGGGKLFDSRHKLHIKPAIAKIRNTEPGDLPHKMLCHDLVRGFLSVQQPEEQRHEHHEINDTHLTANQNVARFPWTNLSLGTAGPIASNTDSVVAHL